MKRENRTFWMDLPRADSGKVQRMMTLWREQPGEQVEQIAGNPAIEKKRQEMSLSTDPVTPDNEDDPVARARKPPPGPTAEELDRHELTHVVFCSWCTHCISSRAKEDPHRRVATHEGRTRSCWIGCFSQVIKNQEFNSQCWLKMTFLVVL